MNEADRLIRDLKEGHSALMAVPLHVEIDEVAMIVKQVGEDHAMNLSVVPMITETDQKLAIGPGTRTADIVV